ncbi:MAG: flagellar export chaperone FliS [Lachnospiraceae bacterium]
MNGYHKYKENSIYSMSGVELLLVLYDEAISRLLKAEYALEDKEYELFEDSLQRTLKIIRYLLHILDMEQPISSELRRIYHYIIYDVSKIKAGREREQEELGRIRHILAELREAFAEAGKKAGDPHIVQNKGILG